MSDNMYDLSGWKPIPCHDSDDVRRSRTPRSSLTDLDGTYGMPVVYTEWADENDAPVLRDYRWPESERVCEHYVPGADQ